MGFIKKKSKLYKIAHLKFFKRVKRLLSLLKRIIVYSLQFLFFTW